METVDKLAMAADTPDVRELAAEYSRSLHDGESLDKVSDVDNIRFTRWTGQTTDGRKHSENLPEGKEAFPWEGASDTRIPLADQIINDTVDVLTTSFSRATLKIGGTEIGDSDAAGVASNMMRWQRDTKLYHTLNRESELLAQYGQQYGWSALFVGWEQKSAVKGRKITMDEVLAMAVQAGAAVESLPEMMAAPEADEQVMELLQAQFPTLGKRKARKAIKELRDTGETILPQAYLAVNQPAVVALKPWEEISLPPETVDLQSARVIFRRVFMTEVELRAKVVDEGWNEDWVEAAVKTAGKSTEFHDFTVQLSDTTSSHVDRQDNLIEVVYAYSRQLDDNNIPGIYYTIFSPISQTGDGRRGHPREARITRLRSLSLSIRGIPPGKTQTPHHGEPWSARNLPNLAGRDQNPA